MNRRELAGSTSRSIVAVLFTCSAVVLGGGGSPNPTTELLLQLVFVGAALAWVWIPDREGRLPRPASRTFWLVGLLVLAVPIAQLVPLPPDVWQALGGQEDRTAALALVGRDQSWQPLTRSAPRTLASLLAMIPALGAFYFAAASDSKARSWLVGAIAALALATAVLGALQVSLGPDGPYLYAENHRTLTGFQANRNAAADVLLIGLVAGAAFLAPSLAAAGARTQLAGPVLFADRRLAAACLAGLAVLLGFATILTASRTGIALLPLVLIGAWAALSPALGDLGRVRWLAPVAALAVLAVTALATLAGGNTALGAVAERFVFAEDGRRELWRDAYFAASQAWPFGVGLGGAQPAMIAAERLEVLEPTLPNRVHNDYLELALEGGVPALAVLAVIAALLAVTAWRSWRARPRERHFTVCGILILLIAAAHSFVDYPLRSMALACLVGTGAGLLIGTPRRQSTLGSSA